MQSSSDQNQYLINKAKFCLIDNNDLYYDNDINMQTVNSSEFCIYCVDFVEQTLDTLVEVIVDTGLVQGCASICEKLEEKYEQITCILFCDLIGVAEFVQIVEQ
jgi:hypothetical protein